MPKGNPWGEPGVAAAGIVISAGLDLPESLGSGKEWIAVDLPLIPGPSGGPPSSVDWYEHYDGWIGSGAGRYVPCD